ncbi:hypothetical protein Sjap_014214 [Stephania japonica]|uniref:SAGA-associated factor 11 n=1 Tax=Stephania japonica TaxID=461633 RepID=A0AAP0NYF6_9MAGN
MGGNSPCASCKLLRRRCAKDCIFAPYFPSDDPHKFAIVHKVFGASNVSKMLLELPVQQRPDAVSSLVYEANARVRDPVYGCVGAISYLQNQVSQLQMQLAVAQAEILCIQMQQDPTTAALASHHHQIVMDGHDQDKSSVINNFQSNFDSIQAQFLNYASSSNIDRKLCVFLSVIFSSIPKTGARAAIGGDHRARIEALRALCPDLLSHLRSNHLNELAKMSKPKVTNTQWFSGLAKKSGEVKELQIGVKLSSQFYGDLLDSIIVDVASECHRIARLGLDRNLEDEEEELRLSTQARARVADPSNSGEANSKYVVDIFGQTHPSVASEIFECMNCGRSIMAGRFAPHLEKCMGRGRKARLKNTRSSTAAQNRYTRGSPISAYSPCSNSASGNRVANGTTAPNEEYGDGGFED